jgi:amidase
VTFAYTTAGELARKIRARETSAREATEMYIDRIERLDGAINAVVVRDFERARAAADAADKALAAGRPTGPLHGVPMTLKESYDIAGLPTTWGIPEMRGNIAASDSEVARRYRNAGAVLLGKTNVPRELADFQSYNDIYGTTNNPWDVTRTPGGSSGGSAAALAAGFVALESGSDIGGSIRNPAHFCGVYGHKPTWNIVPPQGHGLPGMLAPPDLAVVGPLARSAEDLALALGVVAGADPLNAPGWQLNLPKPAKRSLAEYRVAVWPTDERAPVDAEVADRTQQLADRLARLGAKVSDQARPAVDLDLSHETYLYTLYGVVAAGTPEEQFRANVAAVAAMDPNDRSNEAMMARAGVQHHRDWLRYNNIRERIRMAWRAFFDEWDILICPQMATAAFTQDQSPFQGRTLTVNNEVQAYFRQAFWSGVITVAYLPSTVFPTGPSRAGLPIGLQAVSAEYNDYTCIDFARLLAQELGGFVPPPGY